MEKKKEKKPQRKTVTKDERITLRINSKLLEKAAERATIEHMTVSGLITRSLLHYLDTVPPPKSGAV